MDSGQQRMQAVAENRSSSLSQPTSWNRLTDHSLYDMLAYSNVYIYNEGHLTIQRCFNDVVFSNCRRSNIWKIRRRMMDFGLPSILDATCPPPERKLLSSKPDAKDTLQENEFIRSYVKWGATKEHSRKGDAIRWWFYLCDVFAVLFFSLSLSMSRLLQCQKEK